MNIEYFIKLFSLLSNEKFSKPIKWQDDLGFSVIEDYGDGFKSLYKFGIYKMNLEEDLKELSISVSYGKAVGDSISLGTGRNGVWDPLDLNFPNEFFYNPKNNKFFHHDKETTAKDIFSYIETIHKKPTKTGRGFLLRTKLLLWRKFFPFLVRIMDVFLICILWLVSGEKTNFAITKRYFSDKYDEKSVKEPEFKEGQTMTFFGYHARRWSVVFYCSFHLFVYYFFFYLHNNYYQLTSNISRNSFLGLCYVVVSFALTESLIPKLIKSFIKRTPSFFAKIAFRSIKV